MTDERKSVIEEVRINQRLLHEALAEIADVQRKLIKIIGQTATCQCKNEFQELKEIILNIPKGSGKIPERKFHNLQPPPNLPWIKEKEGKKIIRKE